MKIINGRLFFASIISSLLIMIYGIYVHSIFYGLIYLPFTLLASVNRKFAIPATIFSFLSSILVFHAPLYFYPLSLLAPSTILLDLKINDLGYEELEDEGLRSGVQLVALLSFTCLILSSLPAIINSGAENIFLYLPLSMTTAFVGFLAYRGYKGLDYDEIIFKTNGLPQGVGWFMDFNGKIYKAYGNFLTVQEREGEYTVCPVKVGNDYYVADVPHGNAKRGNKVELNFRKVQSINQNDFKECMVVFRVKGLLRNSFVSLEVNGSRVSRIIDSNEVDIPFLPFSDKITWMADNIVVGNVLCTPQQRYSTIERSQKYIDIVYECAKMNGQQTQHLDINSWDPKVWVGENVYGYRIKEVIGEGGNSYVLKAEDGGKSYAIKVLKFSSSSKPQTITISSFMDLFRESNNLVELSNHENLVRLYGIFIDMNKISGIVKGNGDIYLHSPPSIVMEYMEGGTAKDLMRLYMENQDWYQIVKIIIREVALALSHIHSSGYVHLDIKPQNIFFTEKLPNSLYGILNKLSSNPKIIKLGDLGSATKIGGKITQITPEYASPKQLENIILGLGAEKEMDIFSLGMVAYTMLSNKISPIAQILNEALDSYLNSDLKGALIKVEEAKRVIDTWNIDLPSNVPEELRKVVEECIKGKIKDTSEILTFPRP
mgnify:CR=1 FL=1